MPYFAEVQNGVVVRVIVADQTFIDSGVVGDPANWVETDYNAKAGSGSKKNYAGVGYSYDPNIDGFIPPKPHDSWTLDQATCLYEAPKPMPVDKGVVVWDEKTQDWVDLATAFVAVDPIIVDLPPPFEPAPKVKP